MRLRALYVSANTTSPQHVCVGGRYAAGAPQGRTADNLIPPSQLPQACRRSRFIFSSGSLWPFSFVSSSWSFSSSIVSTRENEVGLRDRVGWPGRPFGGAGKKASLLHSHLTLLRAAQKQRRGAETAGEVRTLAMTSQSTCPLPHAALRAHMFFLLRLSPAVDALDGTPGEDKDGG